MKRILVNATHPEEVRVALVDGQTLHDLDVEPAGRKQRQSNVYKARIVRIEPGLEAAFVDYGAERHGFLALKDIARALFREQPTTTDGGRVSIQSVLREQQELVVQVEKEERGNKGAALTTFISLAGRYLVLMPNNPRVGGVSRQIEGDERKEARAAMSGLEIPEGMGLILRTAGIGKDTEELRRDFDHLLQLWNAILEAATHRPAPFLIHQESEGILRVLRDHLRPDVGEILIDDEALYRRARDFALRTMPDQESVIKHYQEDVPLFVRYRIESQINMAFSREVKLTSGGALMIDQTEALTTIDINSARATQGSDIEETALNTNLEAAEEAARQLRLRDLGGLIVIDFIDMRGTANQRKVENRLRQAMRLDRARVRIGSISQFGLLEMSRQRLRPSLGETSLVRCPRCSGSGQVRSVESLAMNVLRIIEEEALRESTSKMVARLPVDTATFLLNEKRQSLSDLQERNRIEIILVPDPELVTPNYSIQRFREQDRQKSERASYSFFGTAEGDGKAGGEESRSRRRGASHRRSAGQPEVPAIRHEVPSSPSAAPAPAGNGNCPAGAGGPSGPKAGPKAGLFQRLGGRLGKLFTGVRGEDSDDAPSDLPSRTPSKVQGDAEQKPAPAPTPRAGRGPSRGRRRRPRPVAATAATAASPEAQQENGESQGEPVRKVRRRRRGGRSRRGGSGQYRGPSSLSRKGEAETSGSVDGNSSDKDSTVADQPEQINQGRSTRAD